MIQFFFLNFNKIIKKNMIKIKYVKNKNKNNNTGNYVRRDNA